MFIRDERGSVTVLVALVIMVLFGFAALTVDAGYLYLRKAQLQDTVDAVALAGGQDLPDPAAALGTVQDYAGKNSLEITGSGSSTGTGWVYPVKYSGRYPGTMEVSFESENYQMQVSTSINFGLFFARVLDKSETPAAAAATVARVKLAAYQKEMTPIVMKEDNFVAGTVYEMSMGPGTGYQGNFGFANLEDYYTPPPESAPVPSTGPSGSDIQCFKHYLGNGYTGQTTFEVGGQLRTITGQMVGNVRDQITDRLGDLIIVPLVETIDVNGTSELVTIVGFAEFRLLGYREDGTGQEKTKVISGEFIRRIENGPSVPGSSEYAIGTLKLIK